jgi:HlyD family secretion protein
VEGRTSILTLIDEGARVKKGDLLIELDASELLDKKIDQQIRAQNAEAAFVGARENLAVVENQAQSDVDKAELAYSFAGQDLKKYREGEYPNQLKEVESKITLAKEEITRAKDKLEWSLKLYDEKFISSTELRADGLAAKKKVLDLELAQNDMKLLKNFTYQRRLAQLKSDVKQTQMALERTKRKAKANVVQAQANLEAKKAEFSRQKDKLKKIERQIEKAKIYAPADGLVVYATSAKRGRRGRPVEPLDEGQVVREHQELIYLPTTSSAKAEVAIHEASLDKIRLGLPAKITVDALPGQTFTGRVAKIAPLPDPQAAFLNPDLKVYKTDIYLSGNSDTLRTGMSCKAEILVDQYKEATYIPVQAVLRIGGKTTVYVVKNNILEPRQVEIGLDNNRMVRIVKGLIAGEDVSLNPPLASAAIKPAADDMFGETGPGNADTKLDSLPVSRIPADQKTTYKKTQEKEQSHPTTISKEKGKSKKKKSKAERRKWRERMMKQMPPEEQERIRNMSREDRREIWRQFRRQN